ncbi:MAG: hypothetical protein LBV41_05295 [Cytophagaceae bacterium]|jgi:hypothetical protein|nr:hypothetical protein [Cytophagaceae bacterium]
MNAINRESILNKTHYGLGIYSHILRLYYPDETVLRLVERDCGLCRNPFNANKETLHIFIEKEIIIGNAFDKEFAATKIAKMLPPQAMRSTLPNCITNSKAMNY